MNRFIGMGRLTADPEIKYTQTNTAVARFSLAIDKRQKSQDGKREADFFNCVAFQQTAEFIGKYFAKGQQVAIEGRLQNNNWTDKDGNKRTTTEIIADQVYFADTKKAGQQQTGTGDVQANSITPAQESDDDLPF